VKENVMVRIRNELGGKINAIGFDGRARRK
jgi:hypothetical protein